MTPAKIVDVLKRLNVVELMMAMQKLRARRTPANQAHVTNLKDSAPMLAADAAEAGLRGFAEIETTVGVAAYAPINALSLLVGGQTGRPGILSQCAVEEAAELIMGMRGLTHYAETVSVYGTEQAYRWRRYAVVEVVPGFCLCVAWLEDALHLGHGLRSPDGLCRRQVHAVPRSPLHHDHQGRRRPRTAERLHQLYRCAGISSCRH